MQPNDDELSVLRDQQFFLHKNSVSKKAVAYLAEIERALHGQVQQSAFTFPRGTYLKSGKISKGENYRGLPYFMLDYPRRFGRDEVLAYRTMLWWGQHFSCTLHLSGPVLDTHRTPILRNLSQAGTLYFCVNSHPWDYHYGPDNYQLAGKLSPEQMARHIDRYGFVKISDFIAVDHWESYKSFTLESFARFLSIAS